MADIRPLRGVRFDRSVVGALGPLLAPPYDVTAEHPTSGQFSVRNIESVNLGSGGDDHRLAARRYRGWLAQGVLRADHDPKVYVHRHRFKVNGISAERTGLLARVRLADWSARIVLPHEATTPGPRRERLQRLRAVEANLSPLYFLYRDPSGEMRDLIAEHSADRVALDEQDQAGASHELAAIADPASHARLARLFADRTLFVADGHHRYEAALRYRDECRAASGTSVDSSPEFVLALLAAVEDPGVIVRPTHRLLTGYPHRKGSSLLDVLEQWFVLRPSTAGVALPGNDVIGRVIMSTDRNVWDILSRPDQRHLSLLVEGQGDARRALGVTAIEGVLGSAFASAPAGTAPRLLPIVDEAEALLQVDRGEADGVFLLPAPSLDLLLKVAEEGDLLPPKSTWFEPKAPAGLVISDLRA